MPEEPESTDPMPDQVPDPAPEPAPTPPVSPLLGSLLHEVEAFWANVFTNVSPNVPTDTHNYLRTETEALKARLSALI